MLALVLLAFATIEQVIAGTPPAVIQQLIAALRAHASMTADGSALVSALVLVTEALTLYLLLTITLHALSGVAGAIGRWAAAAANVITLPVLARSLELTLGGALAVEVLLTTAAPPATLLTAHVSREQTPIQRAACVESRPRTPQAGPMNSAAWAAQLAQPLQRPPAQPCHGPPPATRSLPETVCGQSRHGISNPINAAQARLPARGSSYGRSITQPSGTIPLGFSRAWSSRCLHCLRKRR